MFMGFVLIGMVGGMIASIATLILGFPILTALGVYSLIGCLGVALSVGVYLLQGEPTYDSGLIEA